MNRLTTSIEPVYRRYFSLIRAKCTRVLGATHEAEDVAQETFVRLWRSGLGGADPRSVTAWIYRTATHLAIDQLRRRRLEHGEAAAEAVDHDSPEVLLAARRVLGRVALSLTPEELEVAILSRLDGLEQRELAQLLGCSERTVRRTLARIDRRLNELLEATW